MIIDIHTHTFPEKIAPRALAGLASTSFLTPALDGTLPCLRAAMAEDGVDISVLQPIATAPHQVPKLNDAAIENNRLDGIISFGAMHPLYPDKETEFQRLADEGIKGIKLHPDFQQVCIDDTAVIETLKLCSKYGLIAMIHGGLDISYPEINKSTPERLRRILPLLGDAVIIYAHLGGFGYFEQSVRYLSDTDIFIDTAAVCDVFPGDTIKAVIDAFTPQRVLFGSDSPWSRQKAYIDCIRSLGMSENDISAILGGNAGKLLSV